MKKILLLSLLCSSAMHAMELEQDIRNLINNIPSITITDETESPDSKHKRLGDALLGILLTQDCEQSVKDIINAGADINYYDEINDITPLSYAMKYGGANITKLLLDSGATPTFTKSQILKIAQYIEIIKKTSKIS